jgi:abortive infection bacteriophage resistance protein
MLIPYDKPFLSIDDQIAKLKQRGLIITNADKAKEYLERIGYYRLSGYWHPLRKSSITQTSDGKLNTKIHDVFKDNANFYDVIRLYVFDKKLRLLFLDALERIEIALRVDIALLLGKIDRFAYKNLSLLHGNFVKKKNIITGKTAYEDWLHNFKKVFNQSKDDFIIHYKKTYDGDLPIWIAVELWEFGTLSKFLSGMRHQDIDIIAKKYGIMRPELLTSWIKSMSLLRNICAHHGRLWNRSLSNIPKYIRHGEINILNHLSNDTFANHRLYGVAAPIQFMLRTINPSSQWSDRLKFLSKDFPETSLIKFSNSGFPTDWQNMDLWKA